MNTTLARATTRGLNKVPEVTLWFWIIKILCTSVGESFADYINETLGFGLVNTTILFAVALAIAVGVQFRTRAYTPWIYWLTVVLVSVEGTLVTDNLTDGFGVPLWISSTGFAALLGLVFWAWWRREGTLSIHEVNTPSRESWYWLTVLVTFALGTATGDWVIELTRWGPGAAIMIPLGLLVATVVAWRSGANAVATFWIAYILTRPLGANIGDFLALDKSEGGLGFGTLTPSVAFLAAILGVVLYLTFSRVDQIEAREQGAEA